VSAARAPTDPTPGPRLPSGAVTFLFTDIEGSTRLLASLGDAYESVLDEHRRRIRAAVAAAGGHEVNTEGDALFVAFASPSAAISAAAQAQRRLAEPWPGEVAPKVRMGIHTGEATLAGTDYVGLEVHRAARIGAAGHGGQVLVSSATRSLIEDRLPAGVTLRDLGEHRLKDLARPERLAQLVIEGLPADFPPPRTLDATPNNLPVQLTSFVGREDALAEAGRLLERTRLLTLTGPGGTGKTRLALQVAADVADRFPDGVQFVQLAAISDPSLVLSAIATMTGVDVGSQSPLDAVGEALAKQRRLLVLDNFEQVLGAAAEVATLLRMTDHLKLLVTSRAVLRISGEQELPVPPLALPDPHQVHGVASLSQYEAVRLFIERGVAARPDFAVTNENAPAVAEITARLDGLPLAIELAAARLRLLSPQAILARLGDRLSLLSGGARDLPARQQTLRAAITWSYDLLDSGERDLFERVGVFMGGWTLDAAEAVCGEGLGLDILEGLGSLSEKSLVRPQEDSHGDARFLMLETIRDYSVERFAARPDAGALRERHAAWFLAFAEGMATSVGSEDRGRQLLQLDDDHDNLRAALTWYLGEDRLPEAARLAVALWRFWQQRGHLLEGRQRVDALLAAEERLHQLTPQLRMALLTAAGGIAYWQGDMGATHSRYREGLELARAHGTRAELAEALYNFSFAPAPVRENPNTWFQLLATEAPPIVREAAGIFRELGDAAGEAKSSWGLGTYLLYGAQYAEAEQVLLRALELFRATGDRFGEAWTYHSLSLARFKLGFVLESAADVGLALSLFTVANDVSGITLCLLDLAGATLQVGEREESLRLAGAAETQGIQSGAGLGAISALADVLPPVPPRPTDETGLRTWNEGAALTLEQATALAGSTVQRLARKLRERETAAAGASSLD
jgi:predicted ATPase/class 3 adenylate cyclase